jgi:hypothetical protein
MTSGARLHHAVLGDSGRRDMLSFRAIFLLIAASAALSRCAAGGRAQLALAYGDDATAAFTVTSDLSSSQVASSHRARGTRPIMTISPTSLNFNNVPVGQTSSQNVTLTSSGNSNLTVKSATISGTGFTMSGLTLPETISSGQSATFSVQFAPTSTTGVTGSIVFTDNAGNSPQTLTLTGSAVASGSTLSANPGSVNFGSVVVGASGTQPITLTNNGNTTLTFSQITVSGSGFSQTGLSTSTTIAAGGNMTFNAVFTPSSATAVSGNITLTTNGADSPLVISLSGTGAAAALSLGVNPTSLSFGNVTDGSSSSLTTSLTNNGNSNITISGVSVAGAGFSASGVSNGTVLTPGQSVILTVTFAPTTPGAVSGASVTITSNATNSPTVISLSGTGTHWVSLQWSASPTAGVTYNVYRGTSSGGESTTPLNTSPVTAASCTDTNVTSGQTYYYIVEAVDSAGDSVPSNEVEAVIPTP